MKELSLFSGAGGGLLGSNLLGWKTIGAVEIDEYCCEVLEARQKDGCLEKFPIWNMDIREFNRRVASNYEGLVDVVSAGFPCQPFSAAGRQRAADDERNMWPATIESIRLVRPRYCFLENVPGLLWKSHGYFGTILGELAESGYDASWCCLPAYITGAPQNGTRLWIVASSDSEGLEGLYKEGGGIYLQPIKADVPEQFWSTTPGVLRRGHGVAHKVDRIKAIGNGQVPAVAATAWKFLSENIE